MIENSGRKKESRIGRTHEKTETRMRWDLHMPPVKTSKQDTRTIRQLRKVNYNKT